MHLTILFITYQEEHCKCQYLNRRVWLEMWQVAGRVDTGIQKLSLSILGANMRHSLDRNIFDMGVK